MPPWITDAAASRKSCRALGALHARATRELPGTIRATAVLPCSCSSGIRRVPTRHRPPDFRALLKSPSAIRRRRSTAATDSRSSALAGPAAGRRRRRAGTTAPCDADAARPIDPAVTVHRLHVLAVVIYRQGEMDLGVMSLATASTCRRSAAPVLLAIQPFAVNQFAIDRAGLTMALLAPLGRRPARW